MIRLSASKIGVFKDCPRCFWDQEVGKRPRPRGIFPSLPGGMDLILKNYFNHFRGDLPPFLKGKVPGVLIKDVKRYQNWRSCPSYINQDIGVEIIGAFDDILEDNGLFIPFDNKTRGSAPKDDGSQYYQHQMDIYQLILEANKMPTIDVAYLVYYWPTAVPFREIDRTIQGQEGIIFGFDFAVKKLTCSKANALTMIENAVRCTKDARPAASPGCEYCQYLNG